MPRAARAVRCDHPPRGGVALSAQRLKPTEDTGGVPSPGAREPEVVTVDTSNLELSGLAFRRRARAAVRWPLGGSAARQLLAASATLAVLLKLALVWRGLDVLTTTRGRMRPVAIRALALRLAFPLAAAQLLWFGLFVAGGAR